MIQNPWNSQIPDKIAQKECIGAVKTLNDPLEAPKHSSDFTRDRGVACNAELQIGAPERL